MKFSELSHDEKVAIKTAVRWEPQPGTTLTGTVVWRHMNTIEHPEFGEKTYPVITFACTDRDEYVAVHCISGMLNKAVMEARPQVGEIHSVSYQGRAGGETGDRFQRHIWVSGAADVELDEVDF